MKHNTLRLWMGIGLLLLSMIGLSGCMAALPSDSAPQRSSFAPAVPTASATPTTGLGEVGQAGEVAVSPTTPPPTAAPDVIATEAEMPPPPTATEVLSPTAAPSATVAEPLPTTPPPTATAVPVSPTSDIVVAAPTLEALGNEERWRRQQQERQVFEGVQTFTTTGSELWWYDPVQQQHVILGTFSGEFVAQARFTLKGQGVQALEVPYQVNQSYGLTSLSPALIERIQAAGYNDWIEAYVFERPGVQPR
jgi:hypothetical protein